jgi:multidrug efflux pump subunit AcrA (membrane-fusion protein)
MKKNLIIGAGLVVVLVVAYFIVKGNKSGEVADLLSSVKKGPFKVEIETTGELEAKNSVKILATSSLRDFDIWNVTINSIVEEGKMVKKGDWVASLDPSQFQTKFNQKQIELEKANSKFTQTQLDTTLQMRQARDELINLKYGSDEKQIILEQSKFEPPATIKQAEINLDKAKRAYEQALENYKIKKDQNVEKMREVSAELRKVKTEFDGMVKILAAFNIVAPEDGMVIYRKWWDGKPVKAGSQINLWDPTVATLPDLTKMMSKTYVNEVDVRKIQVGQKVEIGLDAYPDKKLTGVVLRIANVGEQRPNSDAKVFEVSIELDGTDMTLRPSMTTANKILVSVKDNSLFIPLECLHSHFDTITYVYKKEGLNVLKQEVVVAETNANDAIIVKGIEEGDRVFLSIPPGMDDEDFNLLPELNGKRKKDDQEKNDEKAAPAPKVIGASTSPK